MDRKETLDAAAACVLKDRTGTYGAPEDNFRETAELWTPLFRRLVELAGGNPKSVRLEPWMVAWMMGQLKAARLLCTPAHADSWVDVAGYAACGAECATRADTT
ncbi:MAG: DUF6378 domain-containing protein [Alphaproteobacteria bacterium]